MEETSAKNEELQAEVKNLKQESISKEQEIKSLTHRNGLLEAEVEKLEAGIKEAKEIAGQSRDHSTQNESLQRRLQLLEDEAEEADRNMRETNDKYGSNIQCHVISLAAWHYQSGEIQLTVSTAGYVKPTSRLAIMSARCKLLRLLATNGKRNMRR